MASSDISFVLVLWHFGSLLRARFNCIIPEAHALIHLTTFPILECAKLTGSLPPVCGFHDALIRVEAHHTIGPRDGRANSPVELVISDTAIIIVLIRLVCVAAHQTHSALMLVQSKFCCFAAYTLVRTLAEIILTQSDTPIISNIHLPFSLAAASLPTSSPPNVPGTMASFMS